MSQSTESRPPYPPFTKESAIQKVRIAEDAWNSRDPQRVSLAYSEDSRWRNRSEFINGREDIVTFLTRKWSKELDYRLIKELNEQGLMVRRYASINDVPIKEEERKFRWSLGRRPDEHAGLTDLNL